MSDYSNTIPLELQDVWRSHLEARKACQKWAMDRGYCFVVTRANYKGDKRKLELRCKHYGEPRNQDEQDTIEAETAPETFIADSNGIVRKGQNVATQGRNKPSQRFGCPFKMKLRPLSVSSQQWHVVFFYDGGHSHPPVKEKSSYPMNRRIDPKHQPTVDLMISTHATNDQVIGYLASKGAYAKPKDITNRRYTMFNNDPDHAMAMLIEELGNKNYEV